MINTILIISFCLIILCVVNIYKLTIKSRELSELNEVLKLDSGRVLSQRKSSEVRLGKIGENLAPFTEHWPWDANNFRFLGSPIDGIQFTDDEIIIVEIKTGNSRLSQNQKRVKDLVERGKVRFVSFRIGYDEITIS